MVSPKKHYIMEYYKPKKALYKGILSYTVTMQPPWLGFIRNNISGI